jgi:RND superfamily putative drug exporter
MTRWTTFVIARRRRFLAAWLVLGLLGCAAALNFDDLLSNRFTVPGTESERGLELLQSRMGDRPDGTFTLVATGVASRRERAALAAAARRAARAAPGARISPAMAQGRGVVSIAIATPLGNEAAGALTPRLRRAVGHVPGVTTYLSGYPAIKHDTQRIYNADLRGGESIAVPVALLVTALLFGTLGGMVVPLAFAAVTVPTALGVVWVLAHFFDMAVYVTNIVGLIGLAIAVDYSMLVVFRYRQELARVRDPDRAVVATMATAGRTTIVSGLAVAVGLALLVLMPLPFMRSMGLGGVIVPAVAVTASATFLPALLSVMGPRVNSVRVLPHSRAAGGATGAWHRLAGSIMRRPVSWLAFAGVLMVALALPAAGFHLTAGDNRGLPGGSDAADGLRVLERTAGAGALAPHQVAIDTHRPGGAYGAAVVAAQLRLAGALRRDPEIQPASVAAPALMTRSGARAAGLVDRDARVLQVRAAGRSDTGTRAAMDLVHRIRDHYVPNARFPEGVDTMVTGAPAVGVDFISRAYGAFPWVVLAVLAISYLLLLRAFRSVVLPAKAVLMTLLSVGATLGVLTLVFQQGWGEPLGLQQSPQIEAWIPIFLFAMLFGLSMDYEVFLLSRMREEWESGVANDDAVANGLEHTGRVITAAAVIMIAAFGGFLGGSFVGLQQFGLGLAAAILLDATVVRAILVPATMKLLGRWNWYLPEPMRRAMRLAPAPSID